MWSSLPAKVAGRPVRAALLIHDPAHDLPDAVTVLSGTTDIAPTIMHLLGGMRGPNSFTGASIFGRRPSVPTIVGRVGARRVMMADATRKLEHSMGTARRLCRNKEPFFGGAGAHDLDACDVLDYFAWQDELYRKARLLPAAHFDGLTVRDVDAVARRQKLNRAEITARERERVRQSAAVTPSSAAVLPAQATVSSTVANGGGRR